MNGIGLLVRGLYETMQLTYKDLGMTFPATQKDNSA